MIDSIREVVDAVRSGELAAGTLKAALAVVDGTSRVASLDFCLCALAHLARSCDADLDRSRGQTGHVTDVG